MKFLIILTALFTSSVLAKREYKEGSCSSYGMKLKKKKGVWKCRKWLKRPRDFSCNPSYMWKRDWRASSASRTCYRDVKEKQPKREEKSATSNLPVKFSCPEVIGANKKIQGKVISSAYGPALGSQFHSIPSELKVVNGKFSPKDFQSTKKITVSLKGRPTVHYEGGMMHLYCRYNDSGLGNPLLKFENAHRDFSKCEEHNNGFACKKK